MKLRFPNRQIFNRYIRRFYPLGEIGNDGCGLCKLECFRPYKFANDYRCVEKYGIFEDSCGLVIYQLNKM